MYLKYIKYYIGLATKTDKGWKTNTTFDEINKFAKDNTYQPRSGPESKITNQTNLTTNTPNPNTVPTTNAPDNIDTPSNLDGTIIAENGKNINENPSDLAKTAMKKDMAQQITQNRADLQSGKITADEFTKQSNSLATLGNKIDSGSVNKIDMKNAGIDNNYAMDSKGNVDFEASGKTLQAIEDVKQPKASSGTGSKQSIAQQIGNQVKYEKEKTALLEKHSNQNKLNGDNPIIQARQAKELADLDNKYYQSNDVANAKYDLDADNVTKTPPSTPPQKTSFLDQVLDGFKNSSGGKKAAIVTGSAITASMIMPTQAEAKDIPTITAPKNVLPNNPEVVQTAPSTVSAVTSNQK